MSTASTASTQPKANKRAFWLPDELYERVRSYVGRHRNAPENMTINQFAREALEEKLGRERPRKKGKR